MQRNNRPLNKRPSQKKFNSKGLALLLFFLMLIAPLSSSSAMLPAGLMETFNAMFLFMEADVPNDTDLTSPQQLLGTPLCSGTLYGANVAGSLFTINLSTGA